MAKYTSARRACRSASVIATLALLLSSPFARAAVVVEDARRYVCVESADDVRRAESFDALTYAMCRQLRYASCVDVNSTLWRLDIDAADADALTLHSAVDSALVAAYESFTQHGAYTPYVDCAFQWRVLMCSVAFARFDVATRRALRACASTCAAAERVCRVSFDVCSDAAYTTHDETKCTDFWRDSKAPCTATDDDATAASSLEDQPLRYVAFADANGRHGVAGGASSLRFVPWTCVFFLSVATAATVLSI